MAVARVPGRTALYGIFRPLRHSPLVSAATCRRLCRFVRASLPRHRLRLNGAVSHSLFIDFKSIGNTDGCRQICFFVPPYRGCHPIMASHKRMGKYELLAILNVWLRAVHSVSEKSPHSCGGSICSSLPEPPFKPPHAF